MVKQASYKSTKFYFNLQSYLNEIPDKKNSI